MAKNFVKKLKRLITTLIVRRGTDGTVQQRRDRANAIRDAVLDHDQPLPDTPDHPEDQQLAERLRALFPVRAIGNSEQVLLDSEFYCAEFIRPYVELARIYESERLASFNAVPLATSLIPRYMPIDTMTLQCCIFREGISQRYTREFKMQLWSRLFKLRDKAFRKQRGEFNGVPVQFQGFIRTDLVGMSIVKEPPTTQRTGPPPPKRICVSHHSDEQYLDDNTFFDLDDDSELVNITNGFVVIDPNKRDLIRARGITANWTEERKMCYSQVCLFSS